MIHVHCMKTVIGGLSLLLVLSACSSGAKSRTADSPTRSSAVSADPGTTHDPTDRMTSQPRSDGRDRTACALRSIGNGWSSGLGTDL